MAEEHDMKEQWEQAYLRQSYDAAVGRLFKGLVHNLNGVLQVFSMQTELFAMMLGKAQALLARLEASLDREEDRQLAAQLKEILLKRTEAVGQMQAKAVASREIMKRTIMLPDFKQIPGWQGYTINSVIQTEVEFLCADPFFKHKVARNLNLAETMPPLGRHHLEIHQIAHFLLENALDAVRGKEGAAIDVETSLAGGEALLVVRDSGPGLEVADPERIFAPFFTTKPDHLGLGLYLARKLAGECGGSIACRREAATTSFIVRLPPAEVQAP
jgi:signal transduction histidine kinase